MARSHSAASVLAVTAAALLGAVCLAAPAPKPKLDARDVLPGEPVEPALDPAQVAKNPILVWKDRGSRVRSSNNLKQIALAIHNYESAYARMPGYIADGHGKPLLSWRVALLPYLEQEPLYNQFKRDEPWDSAHNIQFLDKMPKVFESPRVKGAKKGYTVYQGFTGRDGLFRAEADMPTIANIPDGSSQTILAMEVSTAVPWTKPIDILFDLSNDLPDFGKAYFGSPIAALCDGSTRILSLKRLSAQTLKHAICPHDGKPLGHDWK